jgi:drug/metabolite transporter (DMT)-like permease
MRHTAPRSQILAGHVALAGAQVAFGLLPIFGTIVFRPGGLSPLGVGAWRVVGGSAVLGTIVFARYGRAAFPAREDLPRFFACAMLGVAVNQGLFLLGLARSTPVNAALVMALIPVFTFGMAAAVGQERFSALRALGVAVALAGLLPLLFASGLHSLGAYGFGNLLMVANAFCYATYLVLAKPLTRRYPTLVIIGWAYLFSLVGLVVFLPGQRLLPAPHAAAAWWGIAYIVLFPTILAYLLNVFALARLRASTTAVYVYAQPLVTATAAWFVFGEQPTPAMLLAAVALFVGIWLVSRRPPLPDVIAGKVVAAEG